MVPSHNVLMTLWAVVKVRSFSNMTVFSLQAFINHSSLFTIFYHIALRIVCQTYNNQNPPYTKIHASYIYIYIFLSDFFFLSRNLSDSLTQFFFSFINIMNADAWQVSMFGLYLRKLWTILTYERYKIYYLISFYINTHKCFRLKCTNIYTF